MQLIVLSAGKGSRLPSKFRNKPKCLIEINSKPLLSYNLKFFKRFSNKILVSGYKNHYLKDISKKFGFTNVANNKYSTTNMVYSLFLTKEMITEDIVIAYGDIIFNDNVYDLLNKNKNILPVNINWLKNWEKRMPMKKVTQDAENIVIQNSKILEIGTKINKKKFPKYQFMGIIRLKKNSFFKCLNFFNKLKNNKIDMTTFLNLCVLNKIISLEARKYNDYWYEVDSLSDYNFAKEEISKW